MGQGPGQTEEASELYTSFQLLLDCRPKVASHLRLLLP